MSAGVVVLIILLAVVLLILEFSMKIVRKSSAIVV